ncbi:MAG: DUF1934 domain-containing protein [Clostridia bacterium]|nr:DUF1934 domain-containing protein [Clostridia bacterium]
MTKRNVMIQISTIRHQIATKLFADPSPEEEEDELQEPEDGADNSDMWIEGRLVTNPRRVELVYDEGELSGMEGSITSIGFDRDTPTLVTMMRSGLVSTAMVFEEGKRHFCVYDTPFSSFQVCVRALTVDNRLLTDGILGLEYLIELQGAQAERCRMTITVTENNDLFAT